MLQRESALVYLPKNTIKENGGGGGGGRLPQSREACLQHSGGEQPAHSILRLSGSCEGPKSCWGSQGVGRVTGALIAVGSWGVKDPSRQQLLF